MQPALAFLAAFVAWLTPASLGEARSGAQEPLSVVEISSPAGDWSSQPNLSVDNMGRVHLVWVSRLPGTTAVIKFATFDGTRWSEPKTIATNRSVVSSSADIPSVTALPGGRLVAHWLQTAPTGRSYGVRVSQSADGGNTWSESVVPHASHQVGENGFVSLFPSAGDSAAIAWLDGRNFAPGTVAGRRETMLITNRFGASGAFSEEKILDTRVCDCCQTAYAITARGPIIAYRDRSPEEIRDISIVQFTNGVWSAPRTVHDDGWRMASCPVNGPALAANGSQVALAWFTAARDTARVQFAFSNDAGTSFGKPVRVDAGDPTGRVSVALPAPGAAWVSWVERTAAGPRLQTRRVAANGTLSNIVTLSPDPVAGFPQMVSSRNTLIVAWAVAASAGAPPTVKVGRFAVNAR